MKILILGAGYGTRLYPLTISIPKALLKIGGRTILDRLFDKIESIKECSGIYIVSNDLFHECFVEWTHEKQKEKAFKHIPIEVINDKTISNDDRLGAIGDIDFAVKEFGINEDMIVTGSDNLFDMDLNKFYQFASKHTPYASLAVHDVKDLRQASLYGIALIDEVTWQVKDFQEKPKKPKGTLAATAVYYYPKEKLVDLQAYMKSSLSKDAPGNLIKWLSKKEKVFAYVFEEKWYDIGDKASLAKADCEFTKQDK